MKNMITASKIAALVLCFIFPLSACASWFNASQYVQVSLDAIYKGDFSKYTEVVGISEQQAQINYEREYKSQADIFAKMFGLTDKNGNVQLSDTNRAKIEDLYKQLYYDVSYEISSDSKSVNGAYEIETKIRPLTVLTANNAAIQNFVNQYNADVTAGNYNDQSIYSDDDLNSIFLQGLLDILVPASQNPTYANEQQLTVHVMHNADKNSYYINADDLNKINQLAIAYPS